MKYGPSPLILLIIKLVVGHTDPSEYFQGSQQRPKLEIIYPGIGEVHDNSEIKIRIRIQGYLFPSQFHDSYVCVGVGTVANGLSEECFDPIEDLTVHANGLSAGETYSLRVVFLERKKAIAVSVRTFRVAAILGLLENKEAGVTIQTALQIAIKHQSSGIFPEAEKIYRHILRDHPQHPDALHLLGLIFYQKGNPSAAIPYIEKALASNHTGEFYHNSLGECFRVMGRLEEARARFELTLSYNPNNMAAAYNLGLTFQATDRWDDALRQFRTVIEYGNRFPGEVSETSRLDATIRECDLLQAQHRVEEAVRCWAAASVVYPKNALIYNELGNLQAQLGALETAMELYRTSASLGLFIAGLNIANVLEMEGSDIEGRKAFEIVLQKAEASGLPSFHIRIRAATVLPRIMPPTDSELFALRHRIEEELEILLAEKDVVVDNAPPMNHGFSLGIFLVFHGMNDLPIKSKLYRVYLRFCPSLADGRFIERSSASSSRWKLTIDPKFILENPQSPRITRLDLLGGNTTTNTTTTGVDKNSTRMSTIALSDEPNKDSMDSSSRHVSDTLKKDHQHHPSSSQSEEQPVVTTKGGVVKDTDTHTPIKDIKNDEDDIDTEDMEEEGNEEEEDDDDDGEIVKEEIVAIESLIDRGLMTPAAIPSLPSNAVEKDTNVHHISLKIGFVSKHLTACSIGYFVQGLIQALATTGYDIHVFMLGGQLQDHRHDSVSRVIRTAAHVSYLLPDDINKCCEAIRNAKIDLLVYPEIGLDPLSYFMSFARLATVQAVMLGHPDTTGVATVDYFISSNAEKKGAEKYYSERLYRMRGLGTVYLDTFSDILASPLSSERSLLIERAKFIESVGLPVSAHLYMVAQPLYKLHGKFDEILSRILLQDKLAYLLVVDSGNKTNWQNTFVKRLVGKYSDDVRSRIAFLCSNKDYDLLRAMSVGHVVLDPYPVSGHLAMIQAMSVGVPVITMPAEFMGGRLAFAMYKLMGYEELVVRSVGDYVNLALSLAHKPKLRSQHVAEILKRKHKLFDASYALDDWKLFLQQAVLPALNRTAKILTVQRGLG